MASTSFSLALKPDEACGLASSVTDNWVAGVLPDNRMSALHPGGGGGGRSFRVVHELLGHSVQGERCDHHQAEHHGHWRGPRRLTCQGPAPRARAPSTATSPERRLDIPDPGGVCDNGELRAAHSATGDQGSCKSATRCEACDSQGKDANEEIKRPQERRFRTAGAAQTGHRAAVAVGRRPGTGKGQTTAEVTDETAPQTSKLQRSLWAKISKKWNGGWKTNSTSASCPRGGTRGATAMHALGLLGARVGRCGRLCPRAAPQSRCRSPHPHRPGQQPSPGPGPMAAP